ncbi:Synembryn-A [Hypsibius exemplaris]|uniref:Synembryn-A n=1 Tax=Hypsibius exemplaris TaxID=2072580 RepID=A0A1W0X5J9_HYPEX|nr:Synembryn-A [Hypsibius exemplaris]
MEEHFLRIFETEEPEKLHQSLTKAVQQNFNASSFPNLSQLDKKRLGEQMAKVLADENARHLLHALTLELLKILARDKTGLEEMINDDLLRCVTHAARLEPDFHGTFPDQTELTVTTEAQKVLCNVVFNSGSAQRYVSRQEVVEALMSRISANKDKKRWSLENQFLDVKLLFILTILCAEIRSVLRNDCHAVQDLCIYATCLHDKKQHTFVNNILCEILKTLFNLVCNISQINLTMSEEMDFVNLGQVCREMLVKKPSDEVKRHVINLLTVVKNFGYSQLVVPIAEDGNSPESAVPFEGVDLGAVAVMLHFLEEKLSIAGGGKPTDDQLSPVLCTLTEAAKAVPVIRRFLKAQILPPLRELHQRPEVGTTMRNKICRLLTSTQISVRDSAGDLLFALCKGNAKRLIKYTGYGNAAGWLADRGLMGLPAPVLTAEDDSDTNSDTEEYSAVKSDIDPMTGAVRVERPDPMAGMSDEQKEHLAMELVHGMDKLLRTGQFKPVAVGADGRPHSVENVMQFREEILKNQPERQSKSDSDSD